MRTCNSRKPITYRDIQELASPRRAPSEKLNQKNPFDDIESQDDEYCELSVSILSENSFDNQEKPITPDVIARDELINSVKQSLVELKNEATLYIQSSDRALKESNKKIRESALSLETNGHDLTTMNFLNELRVSVKTLHEKLEKNEELFSSRKFGDEEIKEVVKSFEEMENNELQEKSIVDNSKNGTKCSCMLL